MTVNYADLYASLAIMWKGMLGLFIVCIFVALLTGIISKMLNRKKNNRRSKDDQSTA